ncbi:hypothetical protein CkaCkLH20_11116 [Colletotrichum karsti]|uniref:Fungal N-terminal domain-containing protein n=1 Tax=Colletotrichum karsti TaxID=1095194 RepID=A0A9P6LDD6_9PEZI|nr:uncharacterized protein CkaCkLH20_11116 [Colletotrichum karsti]KAF9871469.1 hypothetical protein CkaCkLH20_11116 [Colletotrichum karsti]
MAEALGLASGVIAVVDITVKAGSTYVKLTRLWDEVKQVPETLRAQTEEIRDLEDYPLDVETDFVTSPLPEFAPSRTLLERHITKCRFALDELKDAVDDVYVQVTNTRGFRSKIAATKAALRKDDLKILRSKFDRALKLFQLAQAQERRWM